MPIYELECPKCGEVYEVLMDLKTKEDFDSQKVSKKCPICCGRLLFKSAKNIQEMLEIQCPRCKYLNKYNWSATST
jgi:phage FluMu protein Com